MIRTYCKGTGCWETLRDNGSSCVQEQMLQDIDFASYKDETTNRASQSIEIASGLQDRQEEPLSHSQTTIPESAQQRSFERRPAPSYEPLTPLETVCTTTSHRHREWTPSFTLRSDTAMSQSRISATVSVLHRRHPLFTMSHRAHTLCVTGLRDTHC